MHKCILLFASPEKNLIKKWMLQKTRKILNLKMRKNNKLCWIVYTTKFLRQVTLLKGTPPCFPFFNSWNSINIHGNKYTGWICILKRKFLWCHVLPLKPHFKSEYCRTIIFVAISDFGIEEISCCQSWKTPQTQVISLFLIRNIFNSWSQLGSRVVNWYCHFFSNHFTL